MIRVSWCRDGGQGRGGAVWQRHRKCPRCCTARGARVLEEVRACVPKRTFSGNTTQETHFFHSYTDFLSVYTGKFEYSDRSVRSRYTRAMSYIPLVHVSDAMLLLILSESH